jgi:hypothetical protein
MCASNKKTRCIATAGFKFQNPNWLDASARLEAVRNHETRAIESIGSGSTCSTATILTR